MNRSPRDLTTQFIFAGMLCAIGIFVAGCGDTMVNSGVVPTSPGPDTTGGEPVARQDSSSPSDPQIVAESSTSEAVAPENNGADSPGAVSTPGTGVADTNNTADPKPADEDPARPRTFAVEGPGDALRVSFDDLDLLKIINMDPVTPDCVEKMPGWLRGLNGKHVRIRGFMKPQGLSEGIPEFIFVRSTDLCCFGPKGKVYHLIAVKLKGKTTTDYIELKPFDVAGQFRIEKIELDEGLVFLLYHIDDAEIIRK
jgi:hypothetical protein